MNHCILPIAAFFCVVAAGPPTSALGQSSPDISGTWDGALEVPGATLGIVFHFQMTEGSDYSGTMDSPDQGAAGIPLGEISLDSSSLEVAVPSVAGSYSGTVSTDGDSIDGTWSQSGQSFSLPLRRRPAGNRGQADAEPVSGPEVDVAGVWTGRLQVPGGSLRVVFHLQEGGTGGITGTMDSPDQGASGIPLGPVTGSRDIVRISVPAVAGGFEGKLDAEGALRGTWSQSGQSLPLTLRREGTGSKP